MDQTFPNLTQGDKEFADLVRMGLSNKEIAMIRGISASSAKVYRHRLRKKMELSSSEEMEKKLLSI